MENNNSFNQDFPNETNNQEPNKININQKTSNNLEKKEKNIEEKEENDNLGYLPGINHTNFNNFNQKQRLDSTDSPMVAQFKFSIDMPNVSKQRLNEYLNQDLLNALEESPNIPNLNSELPNNKNDNTNPENNPNNLFGFSLYPSNPQNIENNNNNSINNNMNYMLESNFYPNKNYNQRDYTNNFQNVYNNNINFNNYNYNYNINIPETTNISNNLINTLNNNPPVFIPKQMRNKNYNQKDNNLIMDEKNIKFFNNGNKINTKNKFDNNKKNSQNSKKEGKMKKPFEVRIGDWTCSKCNNLNFSFRNKCNRCGIPKEVSEKYQGELMNQEMVNQNINFNFPNDGRF
jgi:hypothetical protein